MSFELPLLCLMIHMFERLFRFSYLSTRSTCGSSPCKIVPIGHHPRPWKIRIRTADPSMQKPVGVTCAAKAIRRKTITEHVLKNVTCKSGLAQNAMVPVQVAPVAVHLIDAFTLEASCAYESFCLTAADTVQFPTVYAQRSALRP